jgi:hypothetical protein
MLVIGSNSPSLAKTGKVLLLIARNSFVVPPSVDFVPAPLIHLWRVAKAINTNDNGAEAARVQAAGSLSADQTIARRRRR